MGVEPLHLICSACRETGSTRIRTRMNQVPLATPAFAHAAKETL
jgi:hypothetical protein